MAEAGQNDYLIDRVEAAVVLGDDYEAVAAPLDGGGAEAGDGVGVSVVDDSLGREAEGAVGGELVCRPGAEGGAAGAESQNAPTKPSSTSPCSTS